LFDNSKHSIDYSESIFYTQIFLLEVHHWAVNEMETFKRYCSVRVCVGMLFFALLIGCGSGPTKPDHIPTLTPVDVTVTLNGQPVADASVLFAPEMGQFAAAGITDSQGKTSLKTDGLYQGVAAGTYKVSVTKREVLELDLGETPDDPAEYAAYEAKLNAQPMPKHLLPERYASFSTSELKVTVTEGMPGQHTFDLTD